MVLKISRGKLAFLRESNRQDQEYVDSYDNYDSNYMYNQAFRPHLHKTYHK